ncbi:hypothetical protein LSTR_LSTR011318 [Laodelphax striatellus]|uniref:Uncharacterized protein n=1 Tax=Laodelphax striatellus TaxID=195883 RepID=A0A482WG83_LAOST|nr:hypothetical protein LSTR_LSTR011318 [Laodelphax striatellus]
MYLRTISFIVISATFSLLSPVLGFAAGQSRGPGNYFSTFRHRDVKDPSEWPFNYVDAEQSQRPIMSQFNPYSYIGGRASMDKFRATDGDHVSRISKMQKPHNGMVKKEDLEELLLDRVVPSHYEEYVDDDYDSDSDFQRGMFNVYLPDGRPQNVNFEGKILRYPQY